MQELISDFVWKFNIHTIVQNPVSQDAAQKSSPFTSGELF